jgi:hypothetical protein
MVTCELWLGSMRLFRPEILRPRFSCATIAYGVSVYCGYPTIAVASCMEFSPLFVVTYALAHLRMRRYHLKILRSKFPVAVNAFKASGKYFDNQPRPQRAPL